MQLPKYQYKTNGSYLDYEFFSDGPKGRIKKIVRFIQIEKRVFNIGFGDLDEGTGEISDVIVTNNKDSRKVLATVASIVNFFMLQYPGASIVAKGSTYSRTRLYRMGISNHLEEISINFEVFGLINKKWESFKIQEEYEAFLIRKK